MFIWNSHAVTYFERCIAQFLHNKQWWVLLLTWPQYVGKTTLIQSMIPQLVQPQFQLSDYRMIADLSDERMELKEINDHLSWTTHVLKIEVDPQKSAIKRLDGSMYYDQWSREIIEWMDKTPIGGTKLLVIENIERMTTQASNALLKTFEEPRPWRWIIATSSNPDQLLDTIKSRMTIIPFHEVPDWDPRWLGRPWLAHRIKNHEKYQKLDTLIKQIETWRDNQILISELHWLFIEVHELGLLPLCIQVLMVKRAQDNHKRKKLELMAQYLTSNVWVGSIVMDVLLE